MAKAKDYYSKSVAEAIRQACADFATAQENLDIEVLETGSAGIFGLCRKRAHIRVSRRQERAAAEEAVSAPRVAEPAPAAPVQEKQEAQATAGSDAAEAGRGRGRRERKRPPRPEKAADTQPPPSREAEEAAEPLPPPSEEVLARVRDDLAQVLQLMGYGSEVKVHFADNGVQCHIAGDYEEQIVGPEGRTLDSLQYLLRKMLSQVLPERMNLAIDVGNFRERRMEELKKTAVTLAAQVKEDGKTQSIPALNPSERRVVHLALQEDKGVRSRSVGEGLFKKVLIYKPGKARKAGPRRRGRQGGGAEEQ